MARSALIVGVTGIVGENIADHLLKQGGWTIHGLARHTKTVQPGVKAIAADVNDADATRKALAGIDVSHVFYCSWARRATEAENCAVNGAMIRNLLAAVEPAPSLTHVALVTGLKHYLGPFEDFGKRPLILPLREEQGRVPIANFYYVQEDALFESAARRGFGWSVHRAHTIIGYCLGNLMNMGVTLACYAAICRETGRPFVFPGSVPQWEGLSDVTDARIIASHMVWAATTPAARNEPFNIVNGEIFRWKWLWPQLAKWWGLEAAPYPGKPTPLEEQMRDAAPVWDGIVKKHGLKPNGLDTLASWWHTDADTGRPTECFTDMTKSRKLGFLEYQETLSSFTDLWTRLRAERIIP
jgi:nucleoside-diphosphate-sugar epimerase